MIRPSYAADPAFPGAFRAAYARHDGDLSALSRDMGMGRSTAIKWAQEFGLRERGAVAGKTAGAGVVPTVVTVAAETPDPIADEVARRARVRNLTHEREAIQAIAGERSLRHHLDALVREVAEAFPAPPPYEPPMPRKGSRPSEETLLLHFSDWHAYEEVDPARVQGLNEYNAPIFARRVRRVVDAAIGIKSRMEDGGGWSIPDLVVCCNGDFVSGTIHEAERHADAPNIVAAVYGCATVLGLAIRDLAAHHREVTVVCTSGNHGRLPDARKMQAKDPSRNWDTLIYLLAEAFLRDVPNVRFIVPDSYIASFEINQKVFVQYHGHSVKSWNSIPFYGLSRWTRNVQALRSQMRSPASYFLCGHFHADSSMPTPGGKLYINGSLIGGTEYSVETLGACDPPAQKMLLVGEHGVTSEWSLHGEIPGQVHPTTYPVRPWVRG